MPYIAAVLPTKPTAEQRAEIKDLQEKGLVQEFTFKVRIKATKKFEAYCAQAMGNARFMYNHLVAVAQDKYKENPEYRFNAFAEQKLFLANEKKNYPWLNKVACDCYATVFRDVEKSFKKFIKDKFDKSKAKSKKAGFPKFHRKKAFEGSFRINGINTAIAMGVHGVHSSNKLHYLRIPNGDKWFTDKDSWVKLCRPIPLNPLQVVNVTIKRDGAGYYACICMLALKEDVRRIHSENKQNRAVCGLDWGLTSKATISTETDCIHVANFKPSDRQEKHVKTLQKKLSRKQHPKTKEDALKGVKASKRYRKAQLQLRGATSKIANQRIDYERKLVSDITRTCCAIGIEDTNNKGMVKNHHLAKAVSNASPGRFLRTLQEVASRRDVLVAVADRFYPSTQKCSKCGAVRTKKDKIGLKERTYVCPVCGFREDRDRNAALNLRALAQAEVDSFKPETKELCGTRNPLGAASSDVMRADLSQMLELLKRDVIVATETCEKRELPIAKAS
ncbi:MAG: transposase [Burkholderiales bacterium]|nr:transposase [Burkholderiales bacterium]